MRNHEHEALWREVVADRAERMRRLIPLERNVLIRHFADKIIDLRDVFRREQQKNRR